MSSRLLLLLLVTLAGVGAFLVTRRAGAAEPSGQGGGLNTTRGLRNNNPGNLRASSKPWQGQVGADADGYLIFDTADHGLRALAINLVHQQTLHSLDTVRKIISKYAPPSENLTAAYIAAVARTLGVDPDDTLRLTTDRQQLQQLVHAVVFHENGSDPYSAAQLAQAVATAETYA